MKENEKKEISDCELGNVSGGTYFNDKCGDFEAKYPGLSLSSACINCVHFKTSNGRPSQGGCDLGHEY